MLYKNPTSLWAFRRQVVRHCQALCSRPCHRYDVVWDGHVTCVSVSKDGTQDLRCLQNHPMLHGEAFVVLRSGSGKPLLCKGECLTTFLQVLPHANSGNTLKLRDPEKSGFQDALQSRLDPGFQASGCPRKPSRASRHRHWAQERKGSIGQWVIWSAGFSREGWAMQKNAEASALCDPVSSLQPPQKPQTAALSFPSARDFFTSCHILSHEQGETDRKAKACP